MLFAIVCAIAKAQDVFGRAWPVHALAWLLRVAGGCTKFSVHDLCERPVNYLLMMPTGTHICDCRYRNDSFSQYTGPYNRNTRSSSPCPCTCMLLSACTLTTAYALPSDGAVGGGDVTN